MKKRIMATVGVASLALTLSTTVSHALLGFEPGEDMGLAVGAPLPEGIFAVDDELYGQRDGNPGHTGLNIPELIWSTPYSFYNTRVEFATAFPVFHSDSYRFGGYDGVTSNPLTDGAATIYNLAGGVLLAHDFGNGFGGSFWGIYHTPNERYIPHSWADLRTAISYTGNGYDLTAQFGYTGTFGSNNTGNNTAPGVFPGGFINTPFLGGRPAPYFADAVNVDLTATKKFGKFEIGFVGFAHTDIENAVDNANATLTTLTGRNFGQVGFTRAGAVAVGGLVGYDFGKFILQGMVTREVATRGAPQLLNGAGKETRGFIRLTVPLYVAPAAPPPTLVARY